VVKYVAEHDVGHRAVRAVLVGAVVAAGTLHDGAVVYEVDLAARVLKAEEATGNGRDRV
jgi:hypothetical protein